MDPKYAIITTSPGQITTQSIDPAHHTIIIVSRSRQSTHSTHDARAAISHISQLAAEPDTESLLFISPDDQFDTTQLQSVIHNIYTTGAHRGVTLLLPYKEPPVEITETMDIPKHTQREDGTVQSFRILAPFFKKHLLRKYFLQWNRLAYELLYPYLNSPASNNIEIIQVGKPAVPAPLTEFPTELLNRSLLIIPHKDSVKLLKRCLLHLNQAAALPAAINVCFDDKGYSRLSNDAFNRLTTRLKIFKNAPGNVGPYPPRHYSITNTEMDYIFFQDSDDIPVDDRFIKQLTELTARDLDMIGSHELRVDEFERKIIIFRYPLNVTRSLDAQCFHPLFHPTALVTRKAYLKTGGFSTNLRFGYDSQFLLRSHFYLKIGNIDDFLYIRFKRPNSLTTDARTSFSSNLRSFLIGRWMTDFRLVLENKLDLHESSLSVQKHSFNYKLVEHIKKQSV